MIENQRMQLLEDIKFRILTSGVEDEMLAEQIARSWVMKN